MTGLFLVLFGLSLSSVATASTNCLATFAAAGADRSPEEMVVDTYRQLWKELGGAKLDPKTVGEVIASEKPFAIPLGPDGGGETLSAKMKQFEAMVAAKGWNTPEMNTRLLQELGTLGAGNVQTAETQQRAVRIAAKPVEWSIPGTNVFVAPDGKVMLLSPPSTARKRIGSAPPAKADISYDPATGKTKERRATFAHRSELVYSPDGKEGYFI